jgi:hypothetical protein
MSPPKPPRSDPQHLSAERIWTALYNAESRLNNQNQPVARTRRGRPPSPNPRAPVNLYLTEPEKALLVQLTAKLKECLPPGSVSQGQAAGFALRLAAEIMEKHGLPGDEKQSDWTHLVDHLMKSL